MYVSRDEARSDLFLAGAFYLFGPLLVGLLLAVVPLGRIPGFNRIFLLAAPLLFTVLVPLLLMRYRGESLRDLGLAGRDDPSLTGGAVAALPVVAAGLGVAALSGQNPLAALPVLGAGPSPVWTVATRVVMWLGLAFLAFYGTVKARDAFGGNPVAIREGAVRVGRFVAIAAGVAIVLIVLSTMRLLSSGDALGLLAYPAGVAAAVYVALRGPAGAVHTTTMPTLITPVVLLAIGPFAITFDALRFVFGVYNATLFAGMGLAVAVLAERSRRGFGILVLALTVALFSRLGGGVPFGSLGAFL